MATFEAQVEGLTGLSIDGSSAPTQTELTQFLTDGAKEVLNALPKTRQRLFTTSNALNGGSPTLTLGGSEVFGVVRNDDTINQPCREIAPQLEGRVKDSSDMAFATATDPVFFIRDNVLNIIPTPTNSQSGIVQTLNYPAVAYGDSAIAKFPDDGEYLVPLYASIKSLQNKMSSKFSELPTDVTLSTLPVPPIVPTLSSNQVASLGTAPVYTQPLVGGDDEPITHNITEGGSKTNFSDWFEIVGDFIQTDEDTELAQVQLQKISTYLNAYSQSMQNQLNIFNDSNVEYQAALQRAIENARLSSTDDAQLLQKYASELSAYSTEVQIYQADATTKIQNYNAKIQKHITDYQWLSTQYAQLKEDYNAGLQRLISG